MSPPLILSDIDSVRLIRKHPGSPHFTTLGVTSQSNRYTGLCNTTVQVNAT